jgi:hypothetical protein
MKFISDSLESRNYLNWINPNKGICNCIDIQNQIDITECASVNQCVEPFFRHEVDESISFGNIDESVPLLVTGLQNSP